MNRIETIRYMGTKINLLEFIVPEIIRVTPDNGIVLDIMAGSNAVSYALKEYYTVYTNDVQEYSKTISDALIVNQSETISRESALSELQRYYNLNLENKYSLGIFTGTPFLKYFSFFENVYSDTYFSKKQCVDIDAIRYSIEFVNNKYRKALYLLALMASMCKVQSTPGHFAQYMPSTHHRIIPLQNMDLLEEFYKKCDYYSSICFSSKKNMSYCMDFHTLLSNNKVGHVDTIYLDSPYSQEQYSRFYHILETIVKYDCPTVNYKAKYREDRFMSSFCYKNKVEQEFESIFNYCKNNNTKLVLSYSNKGLLSVDRLCEIAGKYFSSADLQSINYKHSTQGKGSNPIQEVLITCY